MEPSELELPIQLMSGVNFKFYKTKEIKSLSVKEILNSNIFDKLGHVTVGGLYDNALGPSERDDVCSTCRELEMKCSGHMGHIQLPVLVYNPIYFNVLIKILSASCLQCHRLQVDSVQAHLFKSQLSLLECGIISEVENVADYTNLLLQTHGSTEESSAAVIEEISEFVDPLIKDSEKDLERTKNIEAFRSHIINRFLKKQMVCRTKCRYCKSVSMKIRSEFNAKVSLYSWNTYRQKAANLAVKDPEILRLKKKVMEEVEENIEIDEDAEVSVGKKKSDKSLDRKVLTPLEAKQHMVKIWKKNRLLLKNLYSSLHSGKDDCIDIFFLEVLPIPPAAFRPMNVTNGRKAADPQTTNLNKVLLQCSTVKQVLLAIKKVESDITSENAIIQSDSFVLNDVPGKTLQEKLMHSWVALQTLVNCVMDSNLDRVNKDKAPGIKQILEKKQGLFRKNMMGKRVNYAARSVISPDLCIATSEIGVPEIFAKKLTYPEPATPWNVKELRKAVVNGPNVHPGACAVVNENGFRVNLSAKDMSQRIAIAKRLLAPPEKANAFMGPKTVLRHLKNGDVLLLNRQPTLHKPSIQAHKARILPGQRTLRLHYSNCKAYNADFDGDEMNAHFPQSEKCRAEAYNLVATDYQYLVPKDGSPLGGLIQDSMISGVNLTMRGRIFCRADYCNLVFSALSDKTGKINLLPPSILKPQRLWSGKQVFSTVLLNVIPQGKKRINLTGKAKIAEKSWVQQKEKPGRLSHDIGESSVVIRDGELLCGVLDKGHYGPTSYGLVHSCYELYGGKMAGELLTSLGRLFTAFLQLRGFTLGIEDIKVQKSADKGRRKVIEESQKSALDVVCKALGLPENSSENEIVTALKKAHCSTSDVGVKELDICTKSKTDDFQNRIVKCTMPLGLEKPFPYNNLQLMVQSGAKGSTVNCMQISSLLGQIELEGRRPPLMSSGRFLPSFELYDVSPAAGGFVTGRFLTGIKPQEYFFHCMAGREGLVDTAVKTSRSGYLQRCLIKHLEGLMVCYDMTVRDSDGSVIQFYYGNDGLDISKTPYLKSQQLGFLFENNKLSGKEEAIDKTSECEVRERKKSICKWREKNMADNAVSRKRKSGFLQFCRKYGKNLLKEAESLESKSGRADGVDILCNAWHDLSSKKKKVPTATLR